jgi:uncharacterized membrane protein
MDNKSTRRARTFVRELTPRAGSTTRTAKRIGYFVMIYVTIMLSTVVGFALVGVVSIVIPFVAIPVAFFLAIRLAQAAAKAEEMSGKQ